MKTNGIPFDDNAAGSNGSAANDADWSALQYVLGEMSAEESAAYEQLLATDLQTCERVAAAARLTGDLYDALAVEVEVMAKAAPSSLARATSISRPARSVQRSLWAVVELVAAVCLLVAGGLTLLPHHNDRQELAALDRSEAGPLVAIWTERSAEVAADGSTSADGSIGGAASADRVNPEDGSAYADSDDVDDSEMVAEGDYDVPGWMIAAVDGSNMEVREN